MFFWFSQSIQCVSSGHCVYTNTNKSTFGKNNFSNIPSGCNGVYERMMVLWSTAVVSEKLVKFVS